MKFAKTPLLIVLLSCQLPAFDCKLFLCVNATGNPFLSKLLSITRSPKKRSGQGKSTVSRAEEQFIRKTLEEQKNFCAQTVDIAYAPESVEGWSSLASKDIIEVPKNGKASTAYIKKEMNSSSALLDRYNIVFIDPANLSDAINNIATAKYLNMELAEALKYKDLITKFIENGINLPEDKNVCQRALSNIEKSLKAHKGAILHEYGHIANNHGTNKTEARNFCKYALPGYAASVAASVALCKYTEPERLIIPIIISCLCGQFALVAASIYSRRTEETEADSYNQNPQAIKYLKYYFKTQRLILHQKLKAILGAKYSKLCKSKRMERWLNFVIDPEHPSLLSRLEYCKIKLKKRNC